MAGPAKPVSVLANCIQVLKAYGLTDVFGHLRKRSKSIVRTTACKRARDFLPNSYLVHDGTTLYALAQSDKHDRADFRDQHVAGKVIVEPPALVRGYWM